MHPMEIKIVFEILARPHVDSFYFKAISIRGHVAGESHNFAGFCSCPPQSCLRAWNPQYRSRHRKVKCKGLFYSPVLVQRAAFPNANVSISTNKYPWHTNLNLEDTAMHAGEKKWHNIWPHLICGVCGPQPRLYVTCDMYIEAQRVHLRE